MRRLTKGVRATAVLMCLVLSGCSGSSSSGDDTSDPSTGPVTTTDVVTAPTATTSTVARAPTTITTTTTTTTTVADEPSSTVPLTIVDGTTPESTGAPTTSDPRPIDPNDQALAQAGVLAGDSFAAPWTVISEGRPEPVTEASCSYRPGGAVTLLTNGAAQLGPTVQLGETGAFVYSSSLAFPSEDLAMEYVAIRNTDVWAECYTAQLQQFQTDSGNDYVVSVTTSDSPSIGEGGLESYDEFAVTSPEGSIDRVLVVSVYRYGRAVINETQDYAFLSDADQKQFFDDSYSALLGAYDRVDALL